MSRKIIGAQLPFKMLVPALRGSTDPSKGPSGNPVYKWKTFEQQTCIERPGPNRVVQDGNRPGLAPRTGGLIPALNPNPALGTLEVVGNTFVGPTEILLGEYTLVSGTDFQIGSTVQAVISLVVQSTPSTASIDFGGLVTLVPAGGARTPGANNYNNTLGTTGAIALEIAAAISDGANGFGTLFTVASVVGSSISLVAVPAGAAGNLTVTPSDGTVSETVVTVGLDPEESTASNIAVAIDALPEYSATVAGAIVSIEGSVPSITLFSASGACPYNFALTPGEGTLSGGVSYYGPPILSL